MDMNSARCKAGSSPRLGADPLNPQAQPGNVERLRTKAEVLWDEYAAAQDKAKRTLSIDDGIVAGRAWKAFIDSFLAPEQRNY